MWAPDSFDIAPDWRAALTHRIVKGFKPSPVTAGMETTDPPPAASLAVSRAQHWPSTTRRGLATTTSTPGR